jgi:hypothetical protein
VKLRDGVDPPNHEYIVRCEEIECKRRRYPDTFSKRPFAAMQSARRHAQRCRGHVVYVMDMTTLEAAHRYEVVTQKGWSEEPPY